MESTNSFENLKIMTFENFGTDKNLVDLWLNYLPMELISIKQCPPRGCVCLLHLSMETAKMSSL